MRTKSILVFVAAVLFVCASADGLVLYEVIDLGSVLGSNRSLAYSVNDNGQIVGHSGSSQYATLFDSTGQGNNIYLDAFSDGANSVAMSINSNGQIVGEINKSGVGAVLFDPTGNGNNTILGGTTALSINDNGQIVGCNVHSAATIFDPTGNKNNIDLGTLGGDLSKAYANNNNGDIVGMAMDGLGNWHATFFDPTGGKSNIDLATDSGTHKSSARSINDGGQIVGSAATVINGGNIQAALFDLVESSIGLGTLGGTRSSANAINNPGQIIGEAMDEDSRLHATLFDPTGSGRNVSLNTLIDPSSGWHLLSAYDINNNGWIVGYGINPDGHVRAFLLIPLPQVHNTTQETYHKTIQEGIDSADNGDVIVVGVGEVLTGKWKGDGNRDIDFRGKAITLRSPDPDDPDVVAATIIDCSGTEADPHRGFYFHSGEDANSILEGFTITNGYGPNEPFGDDTYSTGGAIYCNDSSPTIRNCIIRSNYSNYRGGGVDCNDSHAVIENCTFKENESLDTGGGLYNRLSSITVSRCKFINNAAAYGGAMCNVDSAPTVTYSIFKGNSATGKGGAVRNNRASSALVNCVLVGNEAPEGGAIHNRDSETAVVTNCIVWGNSASEIEGSAQITYCDVKGGYPGEGNINADPCFGDHNAGDYHLKSEAGRWDVQSQEWVRDDATSLCIDAGDPFSLVGRELFPNGGRVNMGIYGGTAEASKSYFGEPVCEEAIGGDVNGDCRVDFRDFWIMALHWCEDNNP